MRLLLVGTPEERERLRAQIDHGVFVVAGEVGTLSEARASRIEADAMLVADPRGRRRVGEEMFEEALTPREAQILELLADGLSNKAIAARLSISDQTVKFHVAAICGKLGAANRTDAVRHGIRRGLVSL